MQVLPEETEFAKLLLDMGNSILNDFNIQFLDCCIAPVDADIVQDMII